MQFPSEVVLAVAVSGVVVVCAAAMLLSCVGCRRAGPSRLPHGVLTGGSGLSALSLLVSLVGMALLGDQPDHEARRLAVASVSAAGLIVGGGLLCVGMLLLPGVARSAAEVARLALDGLVFAAAIWFVGWVLISPPTRVLGDGPVPQTRPILAVTVIVAIAVGVTVAVGVRSPRPPRGLMLVGLGVILVSVGGLAVAAGLCLGRPAVTVAGAVALPAGLLLVAVTARLVRRPAAPLVDLVATARASGYAALPVAAMTVAGFYHVLRGGDFTVLGVVSLSMEGFALVARQSVALRDVHGYAARLAEREAHFRELAHTDPLTGLANRRGLLRALHLAADARTPYVLLGLDLDGFKNVNDVRGHDAGDAVLAEVGRRLRANLRPGDLAARLGGDEFAVLMFSGVPQARAVADRLLHVISRPYDQPDGPVFLSVSVGLAGSADGGDAEALLRDADIALRHAKQNGKNRVEQYDATHVRGLRRRTALEHELRGAVDRDELHLAFQPVVALPSVQPVGAEALLRWHHPELGNVRPDEFIPVAEECGMISELGGWVLHQACHRLSGWLAQGHDVWVSVNVSPRELHDAGYADRVSAALRAHRVPPQRLVLEITEHCVATDLAELIRRLGELRAIGVRVALDDFGAGYSSLGQLRNLPLDILKIDHSLVAEQAVRRPDPQQRPFAPMVDVVMRLGHQLGLEVIAEGVTSPTELAAVVAAGCRFGQGQLFGWGVPAEHLEAMLDAATSPGRPALAGRPQPSRPSAQPPAQSVGSVDSAREMREA